MTADQTKSPDEIDRESMAELSRRLGERAARQRAVDPAAAAAARRAALQAYERARARRLRLMLGFAVGAVMGSAIAWVVPTVDPAAAPPAESAAATPEAAPPVSMASAAPASALPDSPSPPPAASVPDTPAVEPAAAQAAPAADRQQVAVDATPVEPLRRDEVSEIQTRLRSFGFNPGPVDGSAGRMTEGAVARYQQDRGQSQIGKVDRQLLEQLRHDPAPPVAQQVAQRAPRPEARATRAPAPRRSDPFEPVRAAGDRFGRWLDSLAR